MSAAQIKHLEDKISKYERIMNGCSRCKAASALEDPKDATSLAVQAAPAGPSRQTALAASSTAPALSSKKPLSTIRQGPSTRSSKRTATTSKLKTSSSSHPQNSQPKTSSTSTDVIGRTSSMHQPSSQSGIIATGPSAHTDHLPVRRSLKQTTAEAGASLQGSPSQQRTVPASTLNPRPTSLRPSTNAVNTSSADTNWVNQSGPILSRLNSNVRIPREGIQKEADWVATADKMLGEIPLGWIWLARLVGLGNSMLAAVAIDTTAVLDDLTGAEDERQNKDHLLRLVQGFAHRHSEQRVNFQHFLLVCLCNVLSAQGIPRRAIVEALQICISDTSERNIGKYLKGAKWANELMNKLFFTDWGYRAIDLLLLWDRPISTYGKITSSLDPTIDYFVSHLTRPEYYRDVQELPNRVHSTIPWIVKKEFGDEISYETVCKALGYSDEYISETKHLHSSSQPRADSSIRSSEDRGSNSDSRSFQSARESADSTSRLPLGPPGLLPSGDIDGAAYSRAWSLLGKQALQGIDHNDTDHRDQAANRNADPQRPRRMIPDRSTQHLGDSTRSALATQHSKRPLSDSHSSQSQSDDSTRRSQQEGERPSREEIGSSSRHGKKDSHKRRDRG